MNPFVRDGLPRRGRRIDSSTLREWSVARPERRCQRPSFERSRPMTVPTATSGARYQHVAERPGEIRGTGG